MIVPADLARFFELCGGMQLFPRSDYPMRIFCPREFGIANVRIVGEMALPGSISNSWYAVAEGRSNEFIAIDLDPEELGRCYDSFWETHADPGNSPTIARSFTELLDTIYLNQGTRRYWLRADHKSLGDAYD